MMVTSDPLTRLRSKFILCTISLLGVGCDVDLSLPEPSSTDTSSENLILQTNYLSDQIAGTASVTIALVDSERRGNTTGIGIPSSPVSGFVELSSPDQLTVLNDGVEVRRESGRLSRVYPIDIDAQEFGIQLTRQNELLADIRIARTAGDDLLMASDRQIYSVNDTITITIESPQSRGPRLPVAEAVVARVDCIDEAGSSFLAYEDRDLSFIRGETESVHFEAESETEISFTPSFILSEELTQDIISASVTSCDVTMAPRILQDIERTLDTSEAYLFHAPVFDNVRSQRVEFLMIGQPFTFTITP